MKKFLTILILLPVFCNAQFGRLIQKQNALRQPVIVAKFNFSNASRSVGDFVNVVGDPWVAVMSGSDTRSGSSISISTVATGSTYWNWNGTVASNCIAGSPQFSPLFPQQMGECFIFHQSTSYSSGNYNLRVSGLNSNKYYLIITYHNRSQGANDITSNVRCDDNIQVELLTANSAPTQSTATSRTTTILGAGTICYWPNKQPDGSGNIDFHISGTVTFGYFTGMVIYEL